MHSKKVGNRIRVVKLHYFIVNLFKTKRVVISMRFSNFTGTELLLINSRKYMKVILRFHRFKYGKDFITYLLKYMKGYHNYQICFLRNCTVCKQFIKNTEIAPKNMQSN